MAIIGIDLGTTNSLACVWRNNKAELIPNALGEYITPVSYTHLDVYKRQSFGHGLWHGAFWCFHCDCFISRIKFIVYVATFFL